MRNMTKKAKKSLILSKKMGITPFSSEFQQKTEDSISLKNKLSFLRMNYPAL